MSLSVLQEEAIRHWCEGKNVKIVAVPGAGKSRVLVEACAKARGLCLILAYNRELCDDTKKIVLELGMQDWVICMTFHGLATYCLGPTHDDVALVWWLEQLETNQLDTTKIKMLDQIDNLLIDEAQDFRPTFLRLLRAVVPVREGVKNMVVGDNRQMLYDYIEDDAASLEYLNHPERYFESQREWTTILLDETHRMTPEIASFVNAVYGTAMRSGRESVGVPVRVFTSNMWRGGALIAKVLHGKMRSEVCILVPRKKNNGPLRAAVNYLAKLGFRIWIHGLDGQDPRTRKNKLAISTWHASKGTQKRVVVVFGFADDADINPGYVALTRAQDELIIIQDEKLPNRCLLNALSNLPQGVFVGDNPTMQLLETPSIEKEPWTPSETAPISADEWRPAGTGKWVTDLIETPQMEEEEEEVEVDVEETVLGDEDEVLDHDDYHEDVSNEYRIAAVMRAEAYATKRVRRLMHILNPTRLDRDMHAQAIREGSHARFVSTKMPDDLMLERAARERVRSLANVISRDPGNLSTVDWAFLACAVRAWNGYHHLLAQLKPYDWMDEARTDNGADYLESVLYGQSNVVYDARLCQTVDSGRVVHARCCVSTDAFAVHTVWNNEIGHGDRMEGAIIAALHPGRMCLVVNLKVEKQSCIQLSEINAKEMVERVARPRVTPDTMVVD